MTASHNHFHATLSKPGLDRFWRRRPVIVFAAALAPLLVWAVARIGLGLDVHSPTFNGQHIEIGPANVFIAALFACLLGWGLLELLERTTAYACKFWIVAAGIVLVLSLSMPLSGTGESAGDRITLILMHVSVGAVLIPGLARVVRSRS